MFIRILTIYIYVLKVHQFISIYKRRTYDLHMSSIICIRFAQNYDIKCTQNDKNVTCAI